MPLTLVPTPIGNLEDITLRALRYLKECELILCEDTRTSGKLLKHYEIDTPMKAFHQHNEHSEVERVVEMLHKGKKICLISDAGSPGISDPGFLLVRSCVEHSVPVEALPGATAFVPALVKSGLSSDRFVFEGFLPHKKGRKSRIEQLIAEERTVVLYESPYRIKKLLQTLKELGFDRKVSLSRELTKLYEETITTSLDEAIAHYNQKEPKGEYVVVLEGQK